jgi:hypothetical protein
MKKEVSLPHPVFSSLVQNLWAAARSEAWNAFAYSNAGVVDSNPIRGMDVCVCLFYLCCKTIFLSVVL